MTNGTALHYTDTGRGEVTLVFLHYFGGAGSTWGKVMDEMKNEYRCVAIDLPGFGNSQGDWDELSVSYCAGKVISIIESLRLSAFVLVGHSMGGKITLAVAATQPVGLCSVVLVAPSPPTPEMMVDTARSKLVASFGNRTALEQTVAAITAQALPQQEVNAIIANNLLASETAWNWWAEQGSREDISLQMAMIKVLVLVISGDKDSNFSTAYLHTEMTKYFSTANFAEIPMAGHLLPIEQPAAVAGCIKNFLYNYIKQ